MKTTLYYFTGTGNTLAFTRQLQKRFGESDIVSIPKAMDGTIEPASTIGIVTPIYMHNMPHIVARFLETNAPRLANADYVFLVFTGGGELGRGSQKAQRLFARQGITLQSVFNVPLPSNYAPYGYPDPTSQNDQFAASELAADRIVETVRSGASHFDDTGTGFVGANIFPGPLYHMGYRYIPKMDGRFVVEDHCTRCGICAKVCPVGNISLLDGRPVWNHRCEQCYACLQWCPVEAIQYGKRTRGVPRYHQPNTTVQEIIASAGSAATNAE
jgi:ferredoxin